MAQILHIFKIIHRPKNKIKSEFCGMLYIKNALECLTMILKDEKAYEARGAKKFLEICFCSYFCEISILTPGLPGH